MVSYARTLILPLCLITAACGDDGAPPAPVARDSGPVDVGSPQDANSTAPDVGDDAGDDVDESALSCTAETYELAVDPISRERRVSVTQTTRGFAFGWGDSRDVLEQARTAEIARDSSAPIVRGLTDDGRSARSVQVSEGYAIWIDDLGTGEHQVIRGSDTRPTEAQYRTLSAEVGEHRAPLLFQVEDGWLAAWLVRVDDTWRIETRTLSADGLGEGVRNQLPWVLPDPNFAMSLADGKHHYAWNDSGDVIVAVTSDDGVVRTEPSVVSTGVTLPGESSLAFDQGFGVVAYTVLIEDVRHEVRARLLGPDGLPVRPERVVSLAPLRGSSPTVGAFGGGYAVAYRAGGPGAQHLRVAFVHGSDGDVIDEYELGDAPFDGESPGVGVDDEGALAVGWANVEERGTVIRGARLRCAAAWLRCGVMR